MKQRLIYFKKMQDKRNIWWGQNMCDMAESTIWNSFYCMDISHYKLQAKCMDNKSF